MTFVAVNRDTYPVGTKTVTGRRIRQIAEVPDGHDLWRKTLTGQDRKIRCGQRIRVPNLGVVCYTTPKIIH